MAARGWGSFGVLALLLGVGCAGGLKAGGELKLDAKAGLKTKLDAKLTTKAETEKKDAEPKGPKTLEEQLAIVLEGAHRSPEHRSRDQYRHPKETLAFFGLKPQMTVLEVEPGSDGWYTELLAPVLKAEGQFIVTNFDANGPAKSPMTKDAKALEAKLTDTPEVYEKTQVVTLNREYVLGEPESVDMVVTFRNSHLWKTDKTEKRVYSAIYSVLKPGGVFGIVQHRACAGASAHRTVSKGYLPQPYVVEQVEAAGFKLEAESHINANSWDTKDHPKGVWNLPPVLAQGERNKEKYLKIGESDRMTLRFRKPVVANTTPEDPGDASPDKSPAGTQEAAPPSPAAPERQEPGKDLPNAKQDATKPKAEAALGSACCGE